MRFRALLILAMAAAALALPAVAADYHFQVAKTAQPGCSYPYYSSLESLRFFLTANKKTYADDHATIYIHIYDDQELPTETWGDLHSLHFIGEKTGTRATLTGGGQQRRIDPKHDDKYNDDTRFKNLIIAHIRGASGSNKIFTYVKEIDNCEFNDIKTESYCLFDNSETETSLTIKDSTFIECHSDDYGFFHDCVRGTAKFEVSHCTFVNCSSQGSAGVFHECGNLLVTDTTFKNCTAVEGGVDCHVVDNTVHEYRRCRFLNCQATGSGSSGDGGALWSEEPGLNVFDSVFYNCKSGGTGAAIEGGNKNDNYGVCNCTFYECTSSYGTASERSSVYEINCYNSIFFHSSPALKGDNGWNTTYDNSVSSDQVFADLTNFKLKKTATTTGTSGVIDLGKDSYRKKLSDGTDLNGLDRYNGTVDVGCTEYYDPPITEDDLKVTNGNDSGDGSLRQAIANYKASSFTSGTIVFNVSEVKVNSQITIDKAGLTVNSANGSRVKINCEGLNNQTAISTGAAATFYNLDFVGKTNNNSRALYTGAQTTVSSCTFSNFACDKGCAIYHSNSDLSVDNCRFEGCKASRWGGGVYCTSTAQKLSITDSTFAKCEADNGSAIGIVDCSSLSGIWVANCSFLECGSSTVLFHALNSLPTFSVFARCTFVRSGYGIYMANVESGTLYFVSCLASASGYAFFVGDNRCVAKRSLFACPVGNATYSTDTGVGQDGCYVVSEDERKYVLADSVTRVAVNGVTQSTYILGEHSCGMEFPGWFVGQNGWSDVAYKQHRNDTVHGLIDSSSGGAISGYDQFKQDQSLFGMISISVSGGTQIAPPVGAVWNVPDYKPLVRLKFVDVFHKTEKLVKKLPGETVTAETPTRSDATFNGWWTEKYSKGKRYFDEQGRQLVAATEMPKTLAGLTLYAGWIGNARLRFINTFSNQAVLLPVLKDEPIPDLPESLKNLKREGMTFHGWYDGGYWMQGKQWYDAAGNPVLDTAEHLYPNSGDTYLYSAWDMHGADIHLDPTIVVTGTTNISHETFAHHATNALFHVKSGGQLYLNSVSITGDTWCVFLRESAIRNDGGTVVCSNCNFASLLTPTNFGAAYCGKAGTAKFINCSFVDNQARTGGAIYAKDGTVSLLNCTIAGNKTLLGGEDNPGGAAIAGTGNASWQIAACTITSNMAASATRGAGLWMNGGSGFLMQISDSVIQGNGKVYEHVYNNVDSGYTRSYACSYYGSKYVSYGEGSGVAEHPTAAVTELGARRTMVCDGVTQTYFAPMNGARTGGQRLWTKDYAEFSCQDTSPGSGWREVTWDILGEQLFEANKISLRPTYIGSRRRNVLQDLIDATPSKGDLEDMTLVVPEGTYDPVDITRPIRMLCDPGEATVEAACRMPCVTISSTPSPVIIGGMAFREGGGASGGGVYVKSGGSVTAVSNCTFDACAVTGDGGGVYDSTKRTYVYFSTFRDCSADNGGGVRGVGNVIGCTFRNCKAGSAGGGGYFLGAVTNSTFTGCSGVGGGGVHSADSVVLCTFTDNKALNGGGICVSPWVMGSTFTGNTAACGGGLYCVDELRLCALTDNVATNWGGGAYAVGAARGCSFKKNNAGQGGGGLSGGTATGGTGLECKPAFARECVFEENVAGAIGTNGTDACGGGAYNTDAMGCTFRKNKSFGRGGGIHTRGAGNARACLFLYNQAVLDGGAVVGDIYNCTFVRNYGYGSTDSLISVQDADSYTSDSLFYYNALPTHADQYSKTAKASYFYDASAGNYHLRESAEVVTDLVGSSSGCRRARDGGWTDPENADLVNVIDDTTYFYIGCYGFVPAAAAGVTVNGMEDSYEDTNLKTSLREAIENAQANPAQYAGADGKIRIKFDESKLFRDGQLPNVALFIDKSGVALTNFTQYPLVIEPPEGRGIIITGENEFRPFYIRPGNRLELVNVTILNATGGHYAMGDFDTGAHGGAVINAGTLVADGCAFRNCRGGLNATGVPAGSGGAIYAVSGSTTAVTRCTFDGCRAARGGAVFQEGGSFATYQTTTFSENRAQDGGAVISGLGGAAYVDTGADTAFVHCTFAGNEADAAGAGVCAKGDPTISVPVVRFLNSLVLGNRCGTEADDIYSSGPVTMVRSWYGAFPNAAQHVTSTESEGGKSPADAFAKVTAEGLAVATTQAVNHVVHTFYRLRDDAGTDGYYAWSSTFGVDIGYEPNASGPSRPTGTVRGSAQGARHGVRITSDQFGDDCGAGSVLPLGAVNKKGSASADLPKDVEDPLCVTSENSLEKAFAYAATATPKDGLVTITFDPSVTAVSLTGPLELETFTAAQGRTLRIVGDGVTISAGGHQAFRVGVGNRLELVGLTITAHCQSSGGAIRVASGSLVAARVTFLNCNTVSDGDEYCDGGAVALIGDDSGATFEECAFIGCYAADGGFGDAVYRETEDIRFLCCTFDDAEHEQEGDIDSPMRVRVEHPDGSFDLFAETLPALKSSLKVGDVVAILNANAQDIADLPISLPLGVTVRDDTEAGAPQLMAAVKQALAASVGTKSWYSVVETPNSVGVQLNENAVPELTGDGAEVDLTADAGTVSVTPANVKPNLWYALEHAETPGGPYTVEEGGWVQANPDGTLPKALTAPAEGARGFYRIVVSE